MHNWCPEFNTASKEFNQLRGISIINEREFFTEEWQLNLGIYELLTRISLQTNKSHHIIAYFLHKSIQNIINNPHKQQFLNTFRQESLHS